MTLTEYQKLVCRTYDPNFTRLSLTDEQGFALGIALGLGGEMGELNEAWTNKDYGVARLELGDICWYMLVYLERRGINCAEIILPSVYPHNQATAAVMSVSGTCGKFIDHVKKFIMQGHDLDLNYLDNQMKQVYIAVRNCLHSCNWRESNVVRSNMDKLLKRYPNAFDPSLSINR